MASAGWAPFPLLRQERRCAVSAKAFGNPDSKKPEEAALANSTSERGSPSCRLRCASSWQRRQWQAERILIIGLPETKDRQPQQNEAACLELSTGSGDEAGSVTAGTQKIEGLVGSYGTRTIRGPRRNPAILLNGRLSPAVFL